MARTKLGSASRFGPRYGTPLKQVVREIEKTQKTRQICPQCGRKSLKRKGYSIWICKKCGAKVAGGAYEPQTGLGKLVERIVKKSEKFEEIAEEIERVKALEKGEEVEGVIGIEEEKPKRKRSRKPKKGE